MSWCTADEIAHLLHESRVSQQHTAPQQRAHADQLLRQRMQECVNFGDVMAEVIERAAEQPSLKLVSALLLKGFINTKTWCSGEAFSDKPHVVSRLWAAAVIAGNTSGSPSGTNIPGKNGTSPTARALWDCLAVICTLEFPTDAWTDTLQSSVLRAIGNTNSSDAASSGGGMTTSDARAFLDSITERAHTNATLWFWLADQAMSHLLLLERQQLSSGAVPECSRYAVQVVLPLLDHKPRPDDCAAVSSAHNVRVAVLNSDAHAELRMSVFHACAADLQAAFLPASPTVPASSRLRSADVVPVAMGQLKILARMTLSADMQQRVIQTCFMTLGTFKDVYFAYCTDAASSSATQWSEQGKQLVTFVESVLELTQNTLFSSPESAGTAGLSSNDLLQTLLCYMIDTDEEELSGNGDTDDAEAAANAALVDLLLDEEETLIGCSTGTPAELASAVLELILEHFFDDMFITVGSSFVRIAAQFRAAPLAHWSALARGLQSLCTVAAEGESPVIDLLPPEDTNTLLQVLYDKLRESGTDTSSSASPLLMGRLLYIFGMATRYTSNASVVESVFSMAMDLATTRRRAATDVSATASVCNTMAVYLAHQVLGNKPSGEGGCCQISADWVSAALWVAATGGPLGALCGGRALLHFVRYSDASASQPKLMQSVVFSNLPQLFAAIEGVCRSTQRAPFGVLLRELLELIYTEHNPDPASPQCSAVVEAVNLVARGFLNPEETRPVVARCLLDLSTFMALADLRKRADPTPCQCLLQLAPTLMGFSTSFAVDDGPHDEATTRAIARAIGAGIATGKYTTELRTCASALVSVGVASASPSSRVASATVSTVGVALSFAMMRDVDNLAADDALLVRWCKDVLVPSFMADNRRGMSYTGACLPLAVALLRQPRLVERLLLSSPASPETSAVAIAIGIWASVASMGDHYTILFSLLAWSLVVRNARSILSNTAATLSTNVYVIPQLHIRDPLSTLPQQRGSIFFAIAAGLAFVKKNSRRASKVKCFDDAVLDAMPISGAVERLVVAAQQNPDPNDAAFLQAVLSSDYADSAAELLRLLEEQLPFLSSSSSQGEATTAANWQLKDAAALANLLRTS